jgi:hypothetical protein
MPIGEGRTVWILGAGFSKSLGGPLLVDLFRQEPYDDLMHVLGSERAAKVAWTQALFNFGQKKKLWEDAEDFLAYVEAACGHPADRARSLFLNGIISRREFLHDALAIPVVDTASIIFSPCASNPLATVLHAFGTETSEFLRSNSVSQEPWRPYVQWMKQLAPDQDLIITFNYDRVLEKLDSAENAEGQHRLQIVLPGHDIDRTRVPVLKLHGSVTWVENETSGVEVSYRAVEQGKTVVIAAPGRSKASLTSTLLKPLWNHARSALKHAGAVVIVGYSFPKTDAQARMELLDALEEDNSGVGARQVHLILGPDVDLPGHRRVLELVRHRLGHPREKFADAIPSKYMAPPFKLGVVVRHPLYAEDFIGDYVRRTVSIPRS